jgi:hypothetical protein
MVHSFADGVCTVCGEYLDYLVDTKLREQSLIGPKFPVDEMQGTFQLSMNVMDGVSL